MAQDNHLQEALELIASLTAQVDAYKVDVDRAKSKLAKAFSKHKGAIGSQFTHGGKWEDLSREELVLFKAVPYELRHFYGKKWGKLVAAAPDTPYVQAYRSLMQTFEQPFRDLKALIDRQKKGRKPDTREREVIGSHTQMRAQCSCCFKEQAVNGNLLVNHGYDLQLGFQNGTCRGAGKPHFGTPEGRDLCSSWAEEFRGREARSLSFAQKIESGEAPVKKKTYAKRAWVMVELDNPSDYQRAQYADMIKREAQHFAKAAEIYEKAAKDWQPRETREVIVEKTRVVSDTQTQSGPKL